VCSSEDLANAKFREGVKICTAPSRQGQDRRKDSYTPLGISQPRAHAWLVSAARDRPDTNRKCRVAVPRRGKVERQPHAPHSLPRAKRKAAPKGGNSAAKRHCNGRSSVGPRPVPMESVFTPGGVYLWSLQVCLPAGHSRGEGSLRSPPPESGCAK
jgi:hypothetical protein